LKTTYHITGDSKYQQEYERLLIDEDYASLVKKAKITVLHQEPTLTMNSLLLPILPCSDMRRTKNGWNCIGRAYNTGIVELKMNIVHYITTSTPGMGLTQI
jgi:hypothetical protein